MGRDLSSNGHSAASYKGEQSQQERVKIHTSDTVVSPPDCLGAGGTRSPRLPHVECSNQRALEKELPVPRFRAIL